MIVLVRGTDVFHNRSNRILSAMASIALGRFNKRVLILQTTTKLPIEKVLMGAHITLDSLKQMNFAMEDTGMDALMRRIVMGPLTGEQFSDCTTAVASTANSLDIANVSKNADFEQYVLENINVFKELLKSANSIYDVVFILADASNKELTSALEEVVDSEVVCIPQGPAEKYDAAPDCFFAVEAFNMASYYNVKMLSKAYNSRKIFPVPYNIGFKDACLRQNARYFMFTNHSPGEFDGNAEFIEYVAKLVGNVLEMDEPVSRERIFIYKPKFAGAAVEEKA